MDAATHTGLLGHGRDDPDPLLQVAPTSPPRCAPDRAYSASSEPHRCRMPWPSAPPRMIAGCVRQTCDGIQCNRKSESQRRRYCGPFRSCSRSAVAVRAAQHDVEVKVCRHVLDRHQTSNPRSRPAIRNFTRSLDRPLAASIGDVCGCVEQHVLYAVLRGEPQILTSRRIELSKSCSHFRDAFRNYPVSSELQVIYQLYGLHCCQVMRTIMFVVRFVGPI